MHETKPKSLFRIILIFTGFLYVVNFSLNDIWTENESFYADSVREMFESGNFFDIKFNYEPRFNKPPLTYWIIAASVKLFGMNEFALRLPVVILAFWTVLLVWAMARMLYGEKTALAALVMQAIGIQFIVGKQYASPEIPLAFFFTLTLYFFLKGHLTGSSRYYRFSSVALGLTVLTKGYPYLIVITGIILFYLILESKFRLELFIGKLKEFKPVSFLLIASIIGLSWVGFMYLRYGNDYLAVLNAETLERALSRESNGPGGLFFYPEVILWSFFPYSLLFVFACIRQFLIERQIKDVAFGLSWLVVMLVIFTTAKGKIPTYFIQAHPALALITAYFASAYKPSGRISSVFWNVSLFLPAVTGIVASTLIIAVFALPFYYHLFTAAALLCIVLVSIPSKEGDDMKQASHDLRVLVPYIGTYCALLVFATGVLSSIEEMRPVDGIGRVINREQHIPHEIPLYLQDDLIFNLPFYSERKVIPSSVPAEIVRAKRPVLAMIRSADVPDSLLSDVIWKGNIYRKRSSESRLLIFIRSYLKARKGDLGDFVNYSLIYRK